MGKNLNFDKIDILLVDDRQANLLSLEAVLASPVYNLIKTTSGDEALRYLLDHTPALILMDVQMPGLNGFETATIIKNSERTREIPIIFITAINKDVHYTYQGYKHGAVDYIYKPYDAQILKSKVAVFAAIVRQQAWTSRLVAVQQAATQALAESHDVNEAILKVLKSICMSLDWELGIFWKVDEKSNLLRCHAEWHAPSNDAPRFIAESFKRPPAAGHDLLGRVLVSQNALWITELKNEAYSSRSAAALKEGLKTAVALPVSTQGEMMGVLEFYSRKKLQEDPYLVKIMEAIGSQICQALKRTAIALENAQLYQEAQEAIHARDEFFSIASHELKTPLTSLKLLLQVTQRSVNLSGGKVPSAEKLSKMLHTSTKQVDQLARLVEDLLDVVKIRSGKLRFNLEEFNLSELVEDLANRYSSALATVKCSLGLDIQPQITGIWDRTRIEQVIVNLISNVIKYAPGTPIKISVSQHDRKVRVSVQDAGPGIAVEQQVKIFERFERAVASHNISGLGLGLFIVKKIVEAHDGTVHIQSQKGKGSTFIMELPIRPAVTSLKRDEKRAEAS